MTTQEAKLKNDIPRKEEHNKFSELYFPDLRSTVCSIFTGNEEIIEDLTRIKSHLITDLNQDYQAVKEHEQLTNDVPIQVEFIDEGLSISIVIREEIEQESKPKIRMIQFCCLDWDNDVELLTILAKALNETILKCTRQIPKLINNGPNFRSINLIETNPVYEYMVLVYSMYKMLHLTESLPGCYVQALMARKRITYNMLCHTLKYNTKLPELVQNWFSSNDIVKKQTYTIRNNYNQNAQNQNSKVTDLDSEVEPQQISQWALHLLDYTGQKFSQRLQFQYAPKRIYNNDRYVNIDGDSDITG